MTSGMHQLIIWLVNTMPSGLRHFLLVMMISFLGSPISFILSPHSFVLDYLAFYRSPMVLYQDTHYYGHKNLAPEDQLPEDSPDLTYVGKIASTVWRIYDPAKELQANFRQARKADVYLHKDGTLYLFLRDGNQVHMWKPQSVDLVEPAAA